MTAHEIDELSSTLGEIKARLKIIENNQLEERQSSQQHRSDLRIVISSQSAATITLSSKVDGLVDRISEMKPLTDDYRETRAQARGGAKAVLVFRGIVVFIAAAIGAIAAYIGISHGR